MINVVVPMAGLGSRFAEEGYEKPKPFIDVMGMPMIGRVVENLYIEDAVFTLIARKQHFEQQGEAVDFLNNKFAINWVLIDRLTEGTACTLLYARRAFNNDLPLVIANSDQLVDGGIKAFVAKAVADDVDGSILTFKDEQRNPKWSYVRLNGEGFVEEVREKVAISSIATVGIYYFRRGAQFVESAIDMIIDNERVNNEFYTCPVYNYLIKDKARINTFDIPAHGMHGIGTPVDLDQYLKLQSRHSPSFA